MWQVESIGAHAKVWRIENMYFAHGSEYSPT